MKKIKFKKFRIKSLISIAIASIILIFIGVFFLVKNSNNKCTIIFDVNGGSKVNSIEIIKGNIITPFVNPTRDNYTFLGWEYNGKLFDFNFSISENMTLVAKWEQRKLLFQVFNKKWCN